MLRDSDHYVFFINWDANQWGALWDDLFEVRWGQRFWPVAVLTLPFSLPARLINGLMTAPVSFGFQVNSDKYNTVVENPFDGESSSLHERVMNTFESAIGLPFHVSSLPVVSGLGGGVWDMLKRRIDRMFSVQKTSPPSEHRKGAALNFLELLAKKMSRTGFWRTKDGTDLQVEITLAGHSMGALVVNRILREYPGIFFKRVIYLGSATSIHDFRSSVIPYLALHKDAYFYSFSLALKHENRERNYWGLIPPGSLLVWIDNLYEPGVSPEHKRIGWWWNVDPKGIGQNKTRDELFIPEKHVCSRIIFLKFSGEGPEGEPKKHGEFNDNRKWQRILKIAMPRDNEIYNPELCVTCVQFKPTCE
jgi:hypothetical protein